MRETSTSATTWTFFFFVSSFELSKQHTMRSYVSCSSRLQPQTKGAFILDNSRTLFEGAGKIFHTFVVFGSPDPLRF